MSFDAERETGKGVAFSVWKFTRPHTIRGTLLASFVGVLRAYLDNKEAFQRVYDEGQTAQVSIRAAFGVLALLFGNAFIVGINQVYDVGIDKINKPYLPVASGEIGVALAWALVIVSFIGGMSIVYATFSQMILWLYFVGLLLGVLYSVPPFRWKTSPVFACLSIATARGILLNFGVYYATLDAMRIEFWWSPAALFIVVFMTIYAATIAIGKDLPDIEGDKKFGVETFATKMGVERMAFLVVAMLTVDYLIGITAAIALPHLFNAPLMAIAHVVLLIILIMEYRKVKESNLNSVKEFYKAMWRNVYAEFILFLFI